MHAAAAHSTDAPSSVAAAAAAARRHRVAGRIATASALHWLLGGLLLFAALVLSRLDVLQLPPPQENAVGLWMEADFLARTHFDFDRLRNEEKSVWVGGARTYVISVLPSLLAALMLAVPSTGALLLICHLLTCACGTLVLLLTWGLMREQVGRVPAAAGVLAVATTPLMNVQFDLLGMELPMLVLALAATWLLVRERYLWAVIASCAAFAIKATGGLLTLAAALYLAGLLIASLVSRQKGALGRYLPGVAAASACWIAQLGLIRWSTTVAELQRPKHQHQAATLLSAGYWCPDLVLLAAGAALLTLVVAAAICVRRSPKWGASGRPDDRAELNAERALRDSSLVHRLASRAYGSLRRDAVLWLSWLVIALTLTAITRISFIPRYLVIAVPYLHLIWVVLLAGYLHRPRWAVILLLLVSALNLINHEGRLFPSMERVYGPEIARSAALLERSREYLADHRSNIDAMRLLAVEAADDVVLAGRPFLDFLSIERLGYVDRPLSGYALNSYTDSLTHFRELSTIIDDPPPVVVLIDVDNTWYRLAGSLAVPEPGPADQMIYDDRQPHPLRAFRHRVPAGDRQELADWYVERMWPAADVEDRAKFRALYLRSTGRPHEALRELEPMLRRDPRDAHLRQIAAAIALELGQYERAVELCLELRGEDLARRALEYDPLVNARFGPTIEPVLPAHLADPASLGPAELHVRDALVALQAGQLERANEQFHAAIDADPEQAEARLALGLFARRIGRLDEAAGHLAAAAQARPDWAAAQRAWSEVALVAGQLDPALAAARRAVELEPQSAAAQHLLALVLLRRGESAAARGPLEEAARLDPHDVQIRGALDRLLQ